MFKAASCRVGDWGALAAFCLDQGAGGCTPQQVHVDVSMVAVFQRVLTHEEALSMYQVPAVAGWVSAVQGGVP